MVTVLPIQSTHHISVGARYFLPSKIVGICVLVWHIHVYSLPYVYFHMLPFITLCVHSRAGHVEVVRAIYPYVAQHVSWCQPRRPDLETWAELFS